MAFDTERSAAAAQTLILHAHTIRFVFDKLACLYKDESSSGELDDAAMAIVGAVDADTFAEVLTAATEIDES